MNRYVRADFMSLEHQAAMGTKSRTHQTCKTLTGVARPGKTAFERFCRDQKRAKANA